MADLGMKVVQAGANINTTDVRDLLMSSQYSMLKYHMDSTSSITLQPGDTDKYVEIAHGLGYVPAFIAYYKIDGVQYFMNPPRASGFTSYPYAWSSSTVVRVGYAYSSGAYNKTVLAPGSGSDYWNRFFSSNNFITVGIHSGNTHDGALRFPAVNLANSETIVSAFLNYHVEAKGAGTGDLKVQTYGIDEDNTASFSSDPFGRAQTTAVTTQTVALPPAGQGFGINVKSQVEEITTRAGWASGNAMGFLLYDNGSPADVNAQDDYPTGLNSDLTILYGSNKTIDFRVIVFKDKLA